MLFLAYTLLVFGLAGSMPPHFVSVIVLCVMLLGSCYVAIATAGQNHPMNLFGALLGALVWMIGYPWLISAMEPHYAVAPPALSWMMQILLVFGLLTAVAGLLTARVPALYGRFRRRNG